jgi:hypothetical protein
MSDKNRLEEYVRALIEAEEAKIAAKSTVVMFFLILDCIMCSIVIAMSPHPFAVGVVLALVHGISAFLVWKSFEDKQKLAEAKRDLLHPTEGEEGFVVAIKKQIGEIFTGAFGKKFTGVRKTDDIK